MYSVQCNTSYKKQKHIFWYKVLHTWYSHLIPPTSIHYILYIYTAKCVILNFSVSKSKFLFLNYYKNLFTQLYRCFVFRAYFLIITKIYLHSFTDASFSVYFLTTVPRFRKFFTQIRFADVIITTLAFYTISNFVYECNNLQFSFLPY